MTAPHGGIPWDGESNASLEDSRAALRRAAYALLIVASTGVLAGRVLSVESEKGDAPFLSANDRSRWCTVRALVDEGRYEIDNVIEDRHPKTGRRYWRTIDMVRHRGWDGAEHYYSSKPPLFPTVLAGEYWLIKHVTGATLEQQTFYVVRSMLLITNVAPLLVYFCLLARLVERHGQTDWGRLFVMAAAAWGTFLTTFAVTINNHLPAAITALAAVCAALPILRGGRCGWGRHAAAGALAALTAANELPALSFAALLGGVLLWISPKRTLTAFAPAAAAVAVAFFGANYAAHGVWRPPYAHRGDGPVLAVVSADGAGALSDGPAPDVLRSVLREKGVIVSDQAQLAVKVPQRRWELRDPVEQVRLALVRSGPELAVRAWDNWYDYEGSYWTDQNKRGVDRGERSPWVYAFHVLAGHHGVFSLSPIWLFSVAGACLALRRRGHPLRVLVGITALATIVCLVFYLARPLPDRNYGGVSCGFRWMFWLTPLWLICILPAADAASRRRGWRLAAIVCLFISVLSASYALGNPWSPPWIFDYWEYVGWIHY